MSTVPSVTSVTNPLVSAFLSNRGLTSESDVAYVLRPDASHQHDPFLLDGVDGFIDRLHDAKGRRIIVQPDYDVDGVASGTTLAVALFLFGFGEVYVNPPRVRDGYGLTRKAVDAMLSVVPDAEVLITTDNGSNAHDGVAYAKEKGLTVLVTDHHVAEADPAADAVVNPNRRHVDSAYPYPAISGTAVIYKVLQAYASRYVTDEAAKADFRSLLFLVGVSTVSDMMPIRDENRYFVTEAVTMFERFIEGHTPARVGTWGDTPLERYYRGLDLLVWTLKENRKLDYGVNAETFGFTLAPILNSPRRMLGESAMAFELFQTTRDEVLSGLPGDFVSDRLFRVNEERKAYVSALSRELVETVDGSHQALTDCTVFTASMLSGVAGLLSSTFTNRYDLPSIAFSVFDRPGASLDTLDGSSASRINASLPRVGYVSGSGRAPSWFDLHAFLSRIDAEHPGLILSWGGHPQAAGIKVAVENFHAFREVFTSSLKRVLAELAKAHPSDGERRPVYAGEFLLETERSRLAGGVAKGVVHPLAPSAMGDETLLEAMRFFEEVAPYGTDFPAPSFTVVFSRTDATFRTMGAMGQHAKAQLSNGLSVIDWNAAPTWGIDGTDDRLFIVTGRLSFNTFNGRTTLQLIANDTVVIPG